MRLYASIRNLLFLALVMLAIPAASHAQIALSVAIAPPELPVYEQPVCPGDDYIWTPGYWYYADDDYVWVPGTWVLAPEVGFLWTPPWWGWEGSAFFFHAGYWGPHIGFYGGINYGFGYFGHGFEGGRWDNGHFFYNRAVMNVGVNIRNVYNTRIDVRTDTHVSFNGGRGGIDARATADEEAAARDRHIGPVAAQEQHLQAARSDPQQRFSTNHGRPAVAATPRAGDFKASGAVGAREAGRSNEVTRPEGGEARTSTPGHVKDLPPAERPAPVKTGDTKTDQKYQQQQEKLNAKQDQERQKVQQQQEREHQQLDQQKANDAKRQQTEQRHQQQTQQLVQKHTQQQQQLHQRQQSAARPSGGGKPK